MSGIGWITNSAFLSALGFGLSVTSTIAAFWMLRKERSADLERRKRVADAVADIQIGQAAALDEMLSRMRVIEKKIDQTKESK